MTEKHVYGDPIKVDASNMFFQISYHTQNIPGKQVSRCEKTLRQQMMGHSVHATTTIFSAERNQGTCNWWHE
jgi:hypothetical protein